MLRIDLAEMRIAGKLHFMLVLLAPAPLEGERSAVAGEAAAGRLGVRAQLEALGLAEGPLVAIAADAGLAPVVDAWFVEIGAMAAVVELRSVCEMRTTAAMPTGPSDAGLTKLAGSSGYDQRLSRCPGWR